jgi:hypothetical protein
MTDRDEPAKKQRRLTDLWSGSKVKVEVDCDAHAATISIVDDNGDETGVESVSEVQLPLSVFPSTTSTLADQSSDLNNLNNPCASAAAYNDIGLAVGKNHE